MSVIHAPRSPRLTVRSVLLPFLALLMLLLYGARLWYVQVAQADEWSRLASVSGEDEVTTVAPRGRIVDRNGVLLAGVRPSVVVSAVFDQMEDHAEVLVEVAAILELNDAWIEKSIREMKWDPYVPVVIYVGADPAAASRLAESLDRLPGIGVELQPARFYPDTKSLAHVLGYVWTPSGSDVERLEKQGITPSTYVGRSGIEMFYEGLLMGQPGKERFAVDARRKPVRSLGEVRAVPGSELRLGIDLRIQRLAASLLEGRMGAIVALDPRNGDVICLASSPSFDAGLYENGISAKNLKTLYDDPGRPLFPRAIGGVYPPGSTFKIVTSLAAWNSGDFSISKTRTCVGYFQYGRRRFGCLGVHGAVDFETAFTKSCNVYFASLAVDVGREPFLEVCSALGLGSKSGIDVPGESAGTVPYIDWLERRSLQWQGGDMVNMAIGQGYIGVTPLQMANVVAFVANRGRIEEPHVVAGWRDAGSDAAYTLPEVPSSAKLDVSDRFWSILNSAMIGVIEYGTATRAQIDGLTWAGKTGSAEHSGEGKTHAWFVGYAPATNPEIAIAVIIERAGHGGEVAAPIAREIVRLYLMGGDDAAPDIQSTVRPGTSSSSDSNDGASPNSS